MIPYESAATRDSNPVYDEADFERRVEFYMSRNTTTHALSTVQEFGCSSTSPSDLRIKQEKRENRDTLKEREGYKGRVGQQERGKEKKDVEEIGKKAGLSGPKDRGRQFY